MLGCLAWPGLSSGMLPSAARGSAAHTLKLSSFFRFDWPPAILPDHVKFFTGGYSCFVDNFGKLVTADLRRPGQHRVLGQTSGLGRRVFDFAVSGKHGYALVLRETEDGEVRAALSIVSLEKAAKPSLLSKYDLPELSTPHSVIADSGYICVTGSSSSGQDLVSIYKEGSSLSTNHSTAALSLVKSFSVETPVTKMAIGERHLFLLESDTKSAVYRIDLTPNSKLPEQIADLDGEFAAMAVNNNVVLAAGRSSNGLEMVLINLLPAPHAVCKQTLGNAQAVYDMVSLKNNCLLLLERNEHINLVNVPWDRSLRLTPAEDLSITKFGGNTETKIQLAAKDQYADVVTGAESIYVLEKRVSGWVTQPPFTIPNLPISNIACWGNYVVLAGSDLSLYEITSVRRTHKVLSAKTEGTVNAVAVAGSYLLCQTKGSLSLRKISELPEVITSIKLSGQRMIYDESSEIVYVMDRQSKTTKVTPVRVYSNNLIADSAFTLPTAYSSVAMFAGSKFVFSGINEVGLYRFGQTPQLVGSRNFSDHAIRAVSSTTEYLVAAAIDHSLKGRLLVLSPDESDGELELISSIELPQDACTIATSSNRVLLAGQSPNGQTLLTAVNLDDPSQPQIETTTEVLPNACALAIKDGLVILAGRGLQILKIAM